MLRQTGLTPNTENKWGRKKRGFRTWNLRLFPGKLRDSFPDISHKPPGKAPNRNIWCFNLGNHDTAGLFTPAASSWGLFPESHYDASYCFVSLQFEVQTHFVVARVDTLFGSVCCQIAVSRSLLLSGLSTHESPSQKMSKVDKWLNVACLLLSVASA